MNVDRPTQVEAINRQVTQALEKRQKENPEYELLLFQTLRKKSALSLLERLQLRMLQSQFSGKNKKLIPSLRRLARGAVNQGQSLKRRWRQA